MPGPGKALSLSNNDTAFVPQGHPHRFLNLSTTEMAMIWVYAGNEPERTLVSSEYCDGTWAWPGASRTCMRSRRNDLRVLRLIASP